MLLIWRFNFILRKAFGGAQIEKLYHNNFKYILVDEFQDTNFIQNKWLNL